MSSWLLCPKIHHRRWKGNFLQHYTEMTTYSKDLLPIHDNVQYSATAVNTITPYWAGSSKHYIHFRILTNKEQWPTKKFWYKERQKGLICWFTSWRTLRVESFILSNSSMQHMPLSASTNAPLWDKVTLFVIWKINWKINTTVLEITGQQSILSSQWDRY